MKIEHPKWCLMYGANDNTIFSCWSLMSGRVTSEEYCKDCDYYKKGE